VTQKLGEKKKKKKKKKKKQLQLRRGSPSVL